jgi:hypothetical protein
MLRPRMRLFVIDATPEQMAKGVKETADLFRRARDICGELDLPATEVHHVALFLDNQVGMLVDADQEAKLLARSKAIEALVQKDYETYVSEVTKATNERIAHDNASASHTGEVPAYTKMFGGSPSPNLGHFQHGVPLGQPQVIDRGPWVQNFDRMNPHDAAAIQSMYSPGGILHRSQGEERRLHYLELDDEGLNKALKAAGLPTL